MPQIAAHAMQTAAPCPYRALRAEALALLPSSAFVLRAFFKGLNTNLRSSHFLEMAFCIFFLSFYIEILESFSSKERILSSLPRFFFIQSFK